MISTRSLNDLLEPVATRALNLINKCREEGIDLLVTCTYRDFEEQDRLFAQGRMTPGQIVTWAQGGDSWHNWRRAFDVVPLRNGKPVWSIRGFDRELWLRVGALGQETGLEWGGSWPRHPDFPHFQDRMGRTLLQLKKEHAEEMLALAASAKRRKI